MTVLFVCTGNTCRSPMAAALFERLCRENDRTVSVCSAGLAADGSPASAQAVTVMRERGIDLTAHRSQPVTEALCRQADLIIPLSPRHGAVLASMGVPPIKLRLLGAVPDPFGGDEAVYRATREALCDLCRVLYRSLFGPVSVEPFAADAVPALAELETLCFSEPWSEQGLSEELTNPCAVFRVARDSGGNVIGYAGMHRVADEGAITNVAVHPAYRGRGIGRQLVQTLLAYGRAESLSRITLEVRPSNTAAVALYESEGFIKVGTRPRFYREPTEDAALYAYIFTSERN